MKMRFEKNRKRLRRTVYWKPGILENGMKLAVRERRSFNDWLMGVVENLWEEERRKDRAR